MPTYLGFTFDEAKAIFAQDRWFEKPSERYLKIVKEGNNYKADKQNKKPSEEYSLVLSKKDGIDGFDFSDSKQRELITEDDLKNHDMFISFMFSVNGNYGPMYVIKNNIEEIKHYLESLPSTEKNTYKSYVGHLAWLTNPNAYGYKDDGLT